ncbi:MAG: hypothetical protein ABIG68_14715 [Acidobacteriota bacterium]
MKYTNDRRSFRARAGMIALMAGLLLGCVADKHLIGAAVHPRDRIPIRDGGPHNGVYRTEDVTLHYQYEKGASEIQVEGRLEYDAGLSYTYRMLDYFFMDIYFLGPGSRVLDHRVFLQADQIDGFDPLSANRRFPLPPGADAVAFGYRGKTRGESTLGAGFDFWRSPVR